MAKTLILLRHAKSSWDDMSMDDHDRPLNSRGERDAPEMGRRLAEREQRPGLIISSDAERALTTARVVAGELGIAARDIVATEELYLASAARILKVLTERGANNDCVMLVGHNPGFTELANRLSDARIDNMPTCSMFCVRTERDWQSLGDNRAEFLWFDYPKLAPGSSD